MLVLAVDVDKELAGGAERGERDGCGRWPRRWSGRSARGGGGAGARPPSMLGAERLREGLGERRVVDGEERLDRSGVAAVADEVGGRALAEDAAEGVDEERFARAGLAGKRVEAGGELYVAALQKREIFYESLTSISPILMNFASGGEVFFGGKNSDHVAVLAGEHHRFARFRRASWRGRG